MKVRVQDTGAEHFVGFHDYVRRRPGDVFSIPDTPTRELSAAEQKMVASKQKSKADYDAIKDKDGKVPQLFSFQWMEPVERGARETITTSQMALDAKSEDIKKEKAAAKEVI